MADEMKIGLLRRLRVKVKKDWENVCKQKIVGRIEIV